MIERFKDRKEAGRSLSQMLARYRKDGRAVVVGLARGGVALAAVLARELGLPLEVCVVRKLGVPRQPELAMGAIAPDGIVVWNESVLAQCAVPAVAMEAELREERALLARREALYRQDRLPMDLEGKVVILVDDGIATGSTVEAAVAWVRRQRPERLILATGVASQQARRKLSAQVDEFACVLAPDHLYSISDWYEDFRQVEDEEVIGMLEEFRSKEMSYENQRTRQ